MARLIYSTITSLDGYVADENGDFAWSAPDEEVHAFVNDTQRPIGTYLYGRRLYEVMAVWEHSDAEGEPGSITADYARIWRAADKVVYSTTLDTVASTRTRLVREFDPVVVRQLKDDARRDISIGGPNLAAHAIRAGLVDVYECFVNPIVVGGGTRALPDDVRIELELTAEHRFANGVVGLRYRVAGSAPALPDAELGGDPACWEGVVVDHRDDPETP